MVEKITGFQFSSRFRKDYRALSEEIQEAFELKLDLFLNDPRHPSLRVKRLIGTNDRWEGSLTMHYRFTFQYQGGTVLFRRIGTHDILKMET